MTDAARLWALVWLSAGHHVGCSPNPHQIAPYGVRSDLSRSDGPANAPDGRFTGPTPKFANTDADGACVTALSSVYSVRRGLIPAAALLATGLATVPAAAASSAHPRLVHAVVVVKPDTALPLQVSGGKVLHVFRNVSAELVAAPLASLEALSLDARVAGMTPDRTGHVAGDEGKGPNGNGVLAAKAIGDQAGKDGTGSGVNVALLDTGLTDTAALSRSSGRVTDGTDVSQLAQSDGKALTSGTFTDGYGHGTFLASLIAGGKVPGSGDRAIGIAPSARIVVVKVADSNGNTSLSEVLAGLDFVAAHARAIQVVNLALAVDRPTAPAYGADPLTAAVEHVRSLGVVVVAASGNVAGQVGDPGLDPQALTVGAADVSKPGPPQVTSFSGSGVVDGVSKPDVVAPGMHVLGVMPQSSLIAQQNPQGWAGNGLFKGSGTSEATAVTSGVVAAYLSDHPNADPATVKGALRKGAQDMKDKRAGQGLVQLVHGNGKASDKDLGESTLDSTAWQNNTWAGVPNWQSWLAASWSGPAWDAASWSAASWSAASWSAASWSAASWSAASWSAASWSAASWSAASWSAASWSDYTWGDQ